MQEVCDLLTEKELRLQTPIEELQLLYKGATTLQSMNEKNEIDERVNSPEPENCSNLAIADANSDLKTETMPLSMKTEHSEEHKEVAEPTSNSHPSAPTKKTLEQSTVKSETKDYIPIKAENDNS